MDRFPRALAFAGNDIRLGKGPPDTTCTHGLSHCLVLIKLLKRNAFSIDGLLGISDKDAACL